MEAWPGRKCGVLILGVHGCLEREVAPLRRSARGLSNRTCGLVASSFVAPYKPFLNPDDCVANSSIPSVFCWAAWRRHDMSGDVPPGNRGTYGLRGRPSCDNPCDPDRKLGPEVRLEVQGRPSSPLAPEVQRSGIAKLRNDARGACCCPPYSKYSLPELWQANYASCDGLLMSRITAVRGNFRSEGASIVDSD